MGVPRNFFGYSDGVTSVGMKVIDPFPADTAASRKVGILKAMGLTDLTS